jgi:hypothetical protein
VNTFVPKFSSCDKEENVFNFSGEHIYIKGHYASLCFPHILFYISVLCSSAYFHLLTLKKLHIVNVDACTLKHT